MHKLSVHKSVMQDIDNNHILIQTFTVRDYDENGKIAIGLQSYSWSREVAISRTSLSLFIHGIQPYSSCFPLSS
jgi:hypothetical protein